MFFLIDINLHASLKVIDVQNIIVFYFIIYH